MEDEEEVGGRKEKTESFNPRRTPFTLTATTGSASVGGPLLAAAPKAVIPATSPPEVGASGEDDVVEEEGREGHVRLLSASMGRQVCTTDKGAES